MATRQKKEANVKVVSLDMEDLTGLGLTPEQAAAVEAKLRRQQELAARELEEVRVNFRWRAGPLARVKQAAQALGMPYQRYMKEVLYRQATEDLVAKGQLARASAGEAGLEAGDGAPPQ